MENAGKVVGRWYVSVYQDEDNKTCVKIYDTNYTGDIWVKELNPQGYQPVSTYYYKTFVGHNGELCLDGQVEAWTMSAEEVYNAQLFAYDTQVAWRNAIYSFITESK